MLAVPIKEAAKIYPEREVLAGLDYAENRGQRLWLLHCADGSQYHFLFCSNDEPRIVHDRWVDEHGNAGCFRSEYYTQELFKAFPDNIRKCLKDRVPILIVRSVENGWSE